MASKARIRKIVERIRASAAGTNVDSLIDNIKLIADADDMDVGGSVREEFGRLEVFNDLVSIIEKHRLHEQVLECAFGAISDLTCECPENKKRAEAVGAIDLVADVVQRFRATSLVINAITILGNISAIPEIAMKMSAKRTIVLPTLRQALQTLPHQGEIARSAVVVLCNMLTFVPSARPEVLTYTPDVITALRNNKSSPEAVCMIAGFAYAAGEERIHHFRGENFLKILLDLVPMNFDNMQLIQFASIVSSMLVKYDEVRQEALTGESPGAVARLICVPPNNNNSFFGKFTCDFLARIIGHNAARAPGSFVEAMHEFGLVVLTGKGAGEARSNVIPGYTPDPIAVKALVQGGVLDVLFDLLRDSSLESLNLQLCCFIYFLILDSPVGFARFEKLSGEKILAAMLRRLKPAAKHEAKAYNFAQYIISLAQYYRSKQLAGASKLSATSEGSAPTAPASASAPPSASQNKASSAPSAPLPFGMSSEEMHSLAKELMAAKPGARPATIAAFLETLQKQSTEARDMVKILTALTEAAQLLADVIVDKDGVKVLLALLSAERIDGDPILLSYIFSTLAALGSRSKEGLERMSRKAIAPSAYALKKHPQSVAVSGSVCKLLSTLAREEELLGVLRETFELDFAASLLSSGQADPLVKQDAFALLAALAPADRQDAAWEKSLRILRTPEVMAFLVMALKQQERSDLITLSLSCLLRAVENNQAAASVFLKGGGFEAMNEAMRRFAKNETLIELSCLCIYAITSTLREDAVQKAVDAGLHKHISKALGWSEVNRPQQFFPAVIHATHALAPNPTAAIVFSDPKENLDRLLNMIFTPVTPENERAINDSISALLYFCSQKKTTLKRLINFNAPSTILKSVGLNKMNLEIVVNGVALLAFMMKAMEPTDIDSDRIVDVALELLKMYSDVNDVISNVATVVLMLPSMNGECAKRLYHREFLEPFVKSARTCMREVSTYTALNLLGSILDTMFSFNTNTWAVDGAVLVVRLGGVEVMADMLPKVYAEYRARLYRAFVAIIELAKADAPLSETSFSLIVSRDQGDAAWSLSCLHSLAKYSATNVQMICATSGLLGFVFDVFLDSSFHGADQKQAALNLILHLATVDKDFKLKLTKNEHFWSRTLEFFKTFGASGYPGTAMNFLVSYGKGDEAAMQHLYAKGFLGLAFGALNASFLDYARASIKFVTEAVTLHRPALAEALAPGDVERVSGVVKIFDRLKDTKKDPETNALLCELFKSLVTQDAKAVVAEVSRLRGESALLTEGRAYPEFGHLIISAVGPAEGSPAGPPSLMDDDDLPPLLPMEDKGKGGAKSADAQLQSIPTLSERLAAASKKGRSKRNKSSRAARQDSADPDENKAAKEARGEAAAEEEAAKEAAKNDAAAEETSTKGAADMAREQEAQAKSKKAQKKEQQQQQQQKEQKEQQEGSPKEESRLPSPNREEAKAEKAVSAGILKGSLQTFSFEELKAGTNDFAQASILSEDGGFGPVYRGVVRGLRVAVKIKLHGTPDSKDHFYRELETLSRCRHENILPLLGSYCAENCWCLVYTLCVNGSLRAALDRSSAASELLPWRKRLCIMVEVLRGLNYLHNLMSPPIVHRDVKSANVLLNHAFSACLGDFGIARALTEVQESQNEDKKHVSTRILGTPGYIDPEYARTGRVTLASDVFGAGVIMSELLSSRPAHSRESDPPDITSIFEELQEEGKPVDFFVDKGALWLSDEGSRGTAAEMVSISLRCMNGRSKKRPTTTELLGEMEKLAGGVGAMPEQLHSAKEDSTGGECVVCFGAKPNNAFIPCGHCCICSDCAKQTWSECPLCRTKVQKAIQIFF